jgi:histidinol-phosphate aminotransferase
MVDSLIRKHLRAFEPYRSARSELLQGRIFLDANELAFGSPLTFDGVDLNRYPDPFQLKLRSLLGEYCGVSAEQVFVGVGSDEVIDLLIRLFCEPGSDSIVMLEPTYGVYRVAAALSNVEVKPMELDKDFQIDLERTLSALSSGTKILFCCSPNNPSGNLLRKADIFKLCRSFSGIVVVDEAYAEFSGPAGRITPQELKDTENLVVLKTLSKAWGLAGIRLGYCLANPVVVSHLLRIKAPYSINAVTSQLAMDAVSKKEFVKSSVQSVQQQRLRLRAELQKLPCVLRIYPSDANFLLVEFGDPKKAFEKLLAGGIVVRRRSEERLKQCLRITVGTEEENTSMLDLLRNLSA